MSGSHSDDPLSGKSNQELLMIIVNNTKRLREKLDRYELTNVNRAENERLQQEVFNASHRLFNIFIGEIDHQQTINKQLQDDLKCQRESNENLIEDTDASNEVILAKEAEIAELKNEVRHWELDLIIGVIGLMCFRQKGMNYNLRLIKRYLKRSIGKEDVIFLNNGFLL
jgi:hypothetical protein